MCRRIAFLKIWRTERIEHAVVVRLIGLLQRDQGCPNQHHHAVTIDRRRTRPRSCLVRCAGLPGRRNHRKQKSAQETERNSISFCERCQSREIDNQFSVTLSPAPPPKSPLVVPPTEALIRKRWPDV